MKNTAYYIAVVLSSISVIFGILREFLIIGLLGFSHKNDQLQLYLSIFYTVGLSIDAMRLACLNLYNMMSLSSLIVSASMIGIPFSIGIAILMSYTATQLDGQLLFITIVGCYFNLVTSLLIFYSQRNNHFLAAQVINVLPNLILIPGILVCYWFNSHHLIHSIIWLTTLIPIVQCGLILLLRQKTITIPDNQKISFFASLITFTRHFSTTLSEQLFQIIARSAFYHYGTGFLSVYAMAIRIYSALRFILIDTFIGSKLTTWHEKNPDQPNYLSNLINSTVAITLIVFLAFITSLQASNALFYLSMQLVLILVAGFYLSTLVRLIYFKINHHENNASLIMRFAVYELIFAMLALLLFTQFNNAILVLLWIGYVAKPLTQLLLLRKRYNHLKINEELTVI